MAGARVGGAELFFERLTAALHQAGETVLPVIRRDAGRAGRLAASGLAPVELRFGGALDLSTRPRLRRVLRAFRPAVAVAWMNRAARALPAGDWVRVGRLGGYYDLRYYRGFDHLVGNTRGIVDWMVARGWAADRVHLLPNFTPDLRPTAPPGAGRLLALGRLHRNKGYDVLIRAMASLPDASLVIAGDGPERAALEGLAATCGVAARVSMPGWQADTARLLAGADVLVCPSRSEVLGNVVLEGFSAGRPVVAAAAAGPSELIEDGRTGLLVPVDDSPRLAGAIGAVLRDAALAGSLAAAGRAAFEAEFAEAAVVRRWRAALAGMAR